MVLAAAREALGDSERAGLALVFGTGYGGLCATVEFLEGVAVRGAAFGSPTYFHQSVHHAPAGQLAIALGMTGLSLTSSSRELSGESALKVGIDLIDSGRAGRVLVVAADEVVPALESAFRAFGSALIPGEGAAALLLGEGPGELELPFCALTGHPVGSLHFPRSQLEPLLMRAKEHSGPAPWVSVAACGSELDSPERQALASLLPEMERIEDTVRFGFNPSGGLLRLVAMALRLRAGARPRSALIHSASLGGGQAAIVLRSSAPIHPARPA